MTNRISDGLGVDVLLIRECFPQFGATVCAGDCTEAAETGALALEGVDHVHELGNGAEILVARGGLGELFADGERIGLDEPAELHDAGSGNETLAPAEVVVEGSLRDARLGEDLVDADVGLVARLEGLDRGRYAGPVGWVDTQGDGEWAIALRGGQVRATDPAEIQLFAGAGIVADSSPEAELAETAAKFVPMLQALGLD